MAAAPDPVARLSWEQALALRARRQRLVERVAPDAALDVVDELAGVHAQLMSSAELTLWARVDGLPADAVETALWQDRTLVKTWAMRGTLHLLPAADLARWTTALATRAARHYLNRSRLRYYEVTRDELQRIADAVDAALREGEPLTRAQLADAVGERTGSAALGDKLRESWGALLRYPAALGSLIFAPGEGQNVRFTHPAAWLDGDDVAAAGRAAAADPRSSETWAALADATRRWLRAGGPMTREELARWWGAAPADGRRMLSALGDEVVSVEVDGDAATWMLAEEAEAASAVEPLRDHVRLLPAFDQWTIAATRHAERLLPSPALRARVYRAQGWISPVLLVDGRMAGVWRHERRGRRLAVAVEPFATRVPAAVRSAVAAEVERLAAFLGGEPELAWGPPEQAAPRHRRLG